MHWWWEPNEMHQARAEQCLSSLGSRLWSWKETSVSECETTVLNPLDDDISYHFLLVSYLLNPSLLSKMEGSHVKVVLILKFLNPYKNGKLPLPLSSFFIKLFIPSGEIPFLKILQRKELVRRIFRLCVTVWRSRLFPVFQILKLTKSDIRMMKYV